MRAVLTIMLLAVLSPACFSKPERIGPSDGGPDGLPSDDAPPGGCRTAECSIAEGTCQPDGFCVIEKDTPNANVMCPPGMKCRVSCTGDGCKSGGVTCGGATACEVLCIGPNACQDISVDCSFSMACSVRCQGDNACKGKNGLPSVRCRLATCDVTCDGNSACEEGISNSGTCTSHCCNGACPVTGTCDAGTMCL